MNKVLHERYNSNGYIRDILRCTRSTSDLQHNFGTVMDSMNKNNINYVNEGPGDKIDCFEDYLKHVRFNIEKKFQNLIEITDQMCNDVKTINPSQLRRPSGKLRTKQI